MHQLYALAMAVASICWRCDRNGRTLQAQIKRDRIMLSRSLSPGFVGLALILSVPLSAQERSVPPTEVAVAADGAAAVVTWTPVKAEGVMYRVMRTLDTRSRPVDLTEPVTDPKFYDSKIE